MKRLRFKPLLQKISVGIVLILMVSCAETGSGDPQVRSAKQQFKSRKTYAQGIIGGGLLGAGIGAISGGLTGEGSWDKDRAKKGAVGGGIVGMIGGGIYANQKVRERERYVQLEQNLDVAIKNAQSTRKAASDFNRVLEGRLASVKRDQKVLRGTLADASAVVNSVNQEIDTQTINLSNAQAARLPTQDRKKLESEIGDLKNIRNRLNSNINKLSRESKKAPVAS